MDDKALLEKIALKDEKAFQLFVEKYHVMVLNVCNNILHNYDDAMDVSQEVFIKIFDSIDRFRGEAKVKTWLYRIAVNKSLNFLRSRKRNRWFTSIDILFEDGNKVTDPEDLEPTADENMVLDEDKKALYFALNKLPKKQHIALTLNNFEDLSYKEIAEIMNISVTEVGVLINRSKKKLKKIILEYYKKN